jgi:hypothetical protein
LQAISFESCTLNCRLTLLRSFSLQRDPASGSHFSGNYLLPVSLPSQNFSFSQGFPPPGAWTALFHAACVPGIASLQSFPPAPPCIPAFSFARQGLPAGRDGRSHDLPLGVGLPLGSPIPPDVTRLAKKIHLRSSPFQSGHLQGLSPPASPFS